MCSDWLCFDVVLYVEHYTINTMPIGGIFFHK